MPAWMHGQDVSAGSQCGAGVCVRGWRCVCTVGVCCGDVYMPMDAYGWHPDTHVLLVRSHLEVTAVLCIWYVVWSVLYIVVYCIVQHYIECMYVCMYVCMYCWVQGGY